MSAIPIAPILAVLRQRRKDDHMEADDQPVSSSRPRSTQTRIAPDRADSGSRAKRIGTGLLLCGLVAAMALINYMPRIDGMPIAASRAAVLVVFTIASWALGLFKEPITTLLFFLFAMLFHVAPAATVFSGFESPAWWLVFGGSVTGIAIRTTGLGNRLGRRVFASSSGTYQGYVSAVVAGSVGLAFIMPSTTGRIFLLAPIVLALADRLGFEPGRAGRTGLVLAVAQRAFPAEPTCANFKIRCAILKLAKSIIFPSTDTAPWPAASASCIASTTRANA
jgi:hypothetical protein